MFAIGPPAPGDPEPDEGGSGNDREIRDKDRNDRDQQGGDDRDQAECGGTSPAGSPGDDFADQGTGEAGGERGKNCSEQLHAVTDRGPEIPEEQADDHRKQSHAATGRTLQTGGPGDHSGGNADSDGEADCWESADKGRIEG